MYMLTQYQQEEKTVLREIRRFVPDAGVQDECWLASCVEDDDVRGWYEAA